MFSKVCAVPILPIFFMSLALNVAAIAAEWTETSFEDFAGGTYADGGANLYTSVNGTIKVVGQQWDLNNDGYMDIVFSNVEYPGCPLKYPNSYIYFGGASGFTSQNKIELPTIRAWGNAIADLNEDGYPDIVFCNERNYQVERRKIDSYIYWGSASGFNTANRTELPTLGALDSCYLSRFRNS